MRKTFESLFLKHPNSVGESYFSHLLSASSFSFKMLFGGIACFLHGVFPFLFIKTGSELITSLHDSMVTHRQKNTIRQADPVE